MVCKSLILHSSVEFSHRLDSRGTESHAKRPSPARGDRNGANQQGTSFAATRLSSFACRLNPRLGAVGHILTLLSQLRVSHRA